MLIKYINLKSSNSVRFSGLQRLNVVSKYFCTICQKAFGTRTDLQRHERAHTGERPYSCEYCGWAWAQKGNMMRHRKANVTAGLHRCKMCGERFPAKCAMRKHESETHFNC